MAQELSRATSASILVGWGALMQVSYWSESRRRRTGTQTFVSKHVVKQEPVDSSVSQPDRSMPAQPSCLIDHPLVCWLVENTAVIAVSLPRFVASLVGGALPTRHKFAISWLGTIVSERVQCALHYILTHVVYSHVPYFHPSAGPNHMNCKGPAEHGLQAMHGGARRIVAEWIEVSVLSQLFVTALQVVVLSSPTTPGSSVPSVLAAVRVLGSSLASIRPLQLCAKLAIVRTVVDIFFALGHWVIHRPWLWHSPAVGHKFHHEHDHPSVLTNQHFTIADLFVEAYGPSIVALMILAKLFKVPVSRLEVSLIGSCKTIDPSHLTTASHGDLPNVIDNHAFVT